MRAMTLRPRRETSKKCCSEEKTTYKYPQGRRHERITEVYRGAGVVIHGTVWPTDAGGQVCTERVGVYL